MKDTMFLRTIVLVVFLCSSSPACAGAEKGAAAHSKAPRAAGAAVASAAALEDIAQGLVEFERRASRYSADEWNFVLGYAHEQHGHFAEAESFLEKASGKLPVVGDHILFYRAVAANRRGKPEAALAFLDQLAAEEPDSAWALEAKVERGRALIALGRHREARGVLESYRRSVDADRAFDADRLIAQSLIDEGNAAAVSFVQNLAVSCDGEAKLSELSDPIAAAGKRFGSDIAAWLAEPAQQLRLAEGFAARSQWDEAARRLEPLVSRRGAGGALGTEAKWLLARAYRNIHRYDEAIRLMEELAGDPAARGFSEGLMNALATTYTKKNEYAKAIALRKQMLGSSPPGSFAAAQMAYKIAFLAMDEGKYDEAIPLWRAALAMRGGGEKREQAEWYLAWSHFMGGKDAEAEDLIDGMLKGRTKRSGIHDRLLYWKGRILLKRGRAAEARAVFAELLRDHPNGYYAELARRRLKGEERQAADFADARGAGGAWTPPPLPEGKGSGSGHLARALFFDRLGLHEEAAREIRASGGAGDADEVFALAARNFAHDVAYRMAEGGFHGMLQGMPSAGESADPVWTAAYPRAYEPLVERLVRGSAVDARLVWAIMRNESVFRPEIASPAGAVGLLQLMPATANRLAADIGEVTIDRRDLVKPSVNIALGVAYLKRLSALFPGNPIAWIASYNAGEEAAGRWLANGRQTDIEEWIEEIPYDETNLYVKKVLLSFWKYQRLYR